MTVVCEQMRRSRCMFTPPAPSCLFPRTTLQESLPWPTHSSQFQAGSCNYGKHDKRSVVSQLRQECTRLQCNGTCIWPFLWPLQTITTPEAHACTKQSGHILAEFRWPKQHAL